MENKHTEISIEEVREMLENELKEDRALEKDGFQVSYEGVITVIKSNLLQYENGEEWRV